MADVIHVQIGGIDFAISSAHSIVLQESGPNSHSFVGRVGHGPGPVRVGVRLELGNMPKTEGLERAFDGGSLWSAFVGGGHRWLTVNSPGCQGKPCCVARIECEPAQVTIHCGEGFVRESHGVAAILNPVSYPLDQLLLMYVLAQEGGAIIHAAGASIGGKGFIFAGRSSAGKTTLSRLLVGQNGIEPLSDDRMVVRNIDGHFRAFGTPWAGDAGIALNKSAPLAGLLFLQHGATNRIAELGRQEALERLLPVASIPWYDREIVPRMLHFCEDLVSHVPCFELHFRPDGEVVHLLRGLAAA